MASFFDGTGLSQLWTRITSLLNNKADKNGSNVSGTWSGLKAGSASSADKVEWNNVQNKPSILTADNVYTKTQSDGRFAPKTHSHTSSQITDFETAVKNLSGYDLIETRVITSSTQINDIPSGARLIAFVGIGGGGGGGKWLSAISSSPGGGGGGASGNGKVGIGSTGSTSNGDGGHGGSGTIGIIPLLDGFTYTIIVAIGAGGKGGTNQIQKDGKVGGNTTVSILDPPLTATEAGSFPVIFTVTSKDLDIDGDSGGDPEGGAAVGGKGITLFGKTYGGGGDAGTSLSSNGKDGESGAVHMFIYA